MGELNQVEVTNGHTELDHRSDGTGTTNKLDQGPHGEFETRLFINNEYINSKSSDRFTCFNPANSSVVTEKAQIANAADVDHAVHSAREAFGAWSKTPPAERAKLILRLADCLEEAAEELAKLEALCTGKAVTFFKAFELPIAIKAFRYYAGWCDKMEGESFPADAGFLRIVTHEPLGVCAAVTGFNMPIAMFAFKVAPAIAAGNTVIVKPSEKTPLASLYIGTIIKKAGFPPGVVNVLSGPGSTGSLLASHMEIDKISFTGSISTGKQVSAAASGSNLKRVTLELGGKSPSVVFPDANLDVAVQWCTQGITLNAGQGCVASSLVYVHEDIKEKFLAHLKLAFESTYASFGDPFNPVIMNVPLVDQKQFDRVSGYITAGKSEARLLSGGDKLFEKGLWMQPTIFVDADEKATIMTDEIFGPVVVVNSFTDKTDIVSRVNDTKYGLAGAVFSQDINRALRVASQIRAGTVGINCCTMADNTVPFGGMKQSGSGRELGKYGIQAYTETKTIFVNMTY